ncbi:hypothetical protein [Streptomyces sp. NPDC020917]|uniref:hypothetical protein n=1 Tax=Streptomyces sp. NPDC020917 TaxID=3365102 RepID=UPI0037B3578C
MPLAAEEADDLGAWVKAQRLDWEQLLPAQRWMLEDMLHLTSAQASKRPPAPRTQAALVRDRGCLADTR